MKIIFDDQSYIMVQKSSEPGKVIILISAKDGSNPLKKIVNSVEITNSQWLELVSDVK